MKSNGYKLCNYCGHEIPPEVFCIYRGESKGFGFHNSKLWLHMKCYDKLTEYKEEE